MESSSVSSAPRTPPGSDPGAGERLARTLPEQHLEPAVPHLEDDREGLVRESRCA